MRNLNFDQAKGLANFFFDLAKGLVLGGVGFGITVPSELLLFVAMFTTIASYLCVKTALLLLKN